MSELLLTPEQEAAIVASMRKHKPYLIRLEEEVQSVQHGSIEVRIEVRNGSVDKITFFNHKSWIREKEQLA
jgi:hypothetical protein